MAYSLKGFRELNRNGQLVAVPRLFKELESDLCDSGDMVGGEFVPCDCKASIVYSAVKVGGLVIEVTPPKGLCMRHARQVFFEGILLLAHKEEPTNGQ